MEFFASYRDSLAVALFEQDIYFLNLLYLSIYLAINFFACYLLQQMEVVVQVLRHSMTLSLRTRESWVLERVISSISPSVLTRTGWKGR